MKKGVFLMALLILNLLIVGNAFGFGAELAVGGWRESIGGSLGYEIEDSNDIINLEHDFDLGDELRFFARANFDLPLFFPNIYVMAAPMKFDGSGSKSVDISYGDVEFAADAKLDACLTIDQYDIALYWGLPVLKTVTNGILNIDVGLNVHIIDVEASLSGQEAENSIIVEESVSETSPPLPMLYVAFQIAPIDALAIAVEGRGISIGDNKVYSVISRVHYQFAGPVFGAAGYRFDTIEIDEEDILVDIDLNGPFAEIGLNF